MHFSITQKGQVEPDNAALQQGGVKTPRRGQQPRGNTWHSKPLEKMLNIPELWTYPCQHSLHNFLKFLHSLLGDWLYVKLTIGTKDECYPSKAASRVTLLSIQEKFHCWSALGMNPVFDRETPWFHRFLQISRLFRKVSVPTALLNALLYVYVYMHSSHGLDYQICQL